MSDVIMSSESGQHEDGNGNVVVASMEAAGADTSPGAHIEKSRKVTSDAQDVTTGRDQASPPAKRMKRGKYISRACTACQQRKIKCEGGDPCAHCKARGRVCVSAAKGQSRQAPRASISGPFDAVRSTGGSSTSTSNQELAARVAQLERRLSMIQDTAESPISYTTSRTRRESANPGPTYERESASPASTQLQRVLEPDGQSFMGELSMNSALVEVDGSLSEESADNIMKLAGELPQDKLPGNNKSGRKVRGWMESILERHGVVADEDEWRRYMEFFFEEIHILYPVLHPPSVWDTFNGLWEFGALWSMADSAEREEKRLSVALVCFCLALGRCCVSTRMTDATGVHSSGWSLCSVGMDLLQDSERRSRTAATSLLGLQILVLRVCYWFRLDATQEAARLVALAVSNAHIMGIHRQNRLDPLPCFRSQLLSRVWWVIFVLDRRMAIESGRPFLIQENNTDTHLPLDLSDEWLDRCGKRSGTAKALEHEIKDELSSGNTTTIPYLIAMVRYSRVVGKAWELIYGVKATPSQPASHMVDYADAVLSNLLETLPKDLTYNPDIPAKTQFETRKRWQVKQTMLLSTCVTFLRILIRRPTAQSKSTTNVTSDDQLESLAICASLASKILNAHKDLKDNSMKYCFPYCHYLTSCTMVMTSLVANEPALKKRYRESILAATRSLRLYCHTIWVSGKMMRWVSKLTLLARRVLQVEQGQSVDKARRMSNALIDNAVAVEEAQPPQQLTPQSGIHDLSQNSRGDIPRSGSVDETNSAYLSNAHSGESQPPSGKMDHELAHMWMMEGEAADNGMLELPEWAMTVFNFETLNGDMYRAGDVANFKDASGNTEMQDDGLGLEISMSETMTMLDTMPHPMYSLDMHMD